MTGGFHGLCVPPPTSARHPRASNARASSWFLPEVPCPLMGAGQEGSPRGGAPQPRTLWQGRKPSPALKVSLWLLELASSPSCLIPRSRVLPQINCTPQILFSLETAEGGEEELLPALRVWVLTLLVCDEPGLQWTRWAQGGIIFGSSSRPPCVRSSREGLLLIGCIMFFTFSLENLAQLYWEYRRGAVSSSPEPARRPSLLGRTLGFHSP